MTEEERIYSKAFKEVYVIINSLNEELYIKIPTSLIKTIKSKMDKKYNVSIENLNKNGFLQETKDCMALIYRDYLCDEKTKIKLQQEELLNKENMVYKNNMENIFNKNQDINNYDTIQSNDKTEILTTNLYNKWYEKIIIKIKLLISNFFKKK